MSTTGKLKELLRARVYNGRMFVPSVGNRWAPSDIHCYDHEGVYSVMMRPEEKTVVKDFILNTFYAQAPVPKALGLGLRHGDMTIVDQELALMLDSGVSQIWLDGSNGRMLGACVNCVWPVDNNYDSFEVDPTDWLNVAAELAEESAESRPDLENDDSRNLHLATVWRDFQYQLIYHVFQREAKRQCKEAIFYQGMGFIQPAFRGKNVIQAAFANLRRSMPQNILLGTLTTFSTPDHLFGANSAVVEVARVRYLDLKLRWFCHGNSDRRLVFGHLAKAGQVTFGASRYQQLEAEPVSISLRDNEVKAL